MAEVAEFREKKWTHLCLLTQPHAVTRFVLNGQKVPRPASQIKLPCVHASLTAPAVIMKLVTPTGPRPANSRGTAAATPGLPRLTRLVITDSLVLSLTAYYDSV